MPGGSFDFMPFAQILGLEHENEYVKETITFLFTLAIVQDLEQKYSRNVVQFIGVSILRAVGGYGFLLPLLLGKMPGSLLTEFDIHVYTVVFAIAFAFFLGEFIPDDVSEYLRRFEHLSNAIVRANQCGLAYALGKATFGDSLFAPMLCAYVGCNGQEFLLHGMQSFSATNLEPNEILAVLGGPIVWALNTQFGAEPLQCRVALVVFRLSADYIDYDKMVNNFVKGAKGVAGSALPTASSAPKSRKRSMSTTRRRR